MRAVAIGIPLFVLVAGLAVTDAVQIADAFDFFAVTIGALFSGALAVVLMR
jgi:hypothetical protein